MEGETCGLLSPGSCGHSQHRASGHQDDAASSNSPCLSASLKNEKLEPQWRAQRYPHTPATSPPGWRSQGIGDTGTRRVFLLLCLVLPSYVKNQV